MLNMPSDRLQKAWIVPSSKLRSSSKSRPVNQAKKLVAKKEIKKYLCAALKSVSDDVFEISKVITSNPTIIINCRYNIYSLIAAPVCKHGHFSSSKNGNSHALR